MKITLGTTYFNNYEDIIKFVNKHIDYVDELIIVDDGSHVYSLKDYVTPTDKIKLYEVTENLGFNSHGCRNLIMTVASNDWVLLMDSDRYFVNPEDLLIVKKKKLKDHVRYEFMCDRGIVCCNNFLIHKQHFFKAGGYDEELVGYRSGDREYFKQLLKFGDERVLHGFTIHFEDRGPTKLLTDKHQRDLYGSEDSFIPEAIVDIVNRRIKSPMNNKPILQFSWRQITSDAVTTSH